MSGATLERRLANYRAAIRSSAEPARPGDRVDGGVARGSIELGQRNADYAEVKSGLQPGMAVILHPSDQIRDGSSVVAGD